MNRINQILQISSIDGAMQIKEMINGWSNAEIIQFHRELMELNKNGNESDKKTYTTCDDRNENCKNRSEASVCLKHLNGTCYANPSVRICGSCPDYEI